MLITKGSSTNIPGSDLRDGHFDILNKQLHPDDREKARRVPIRFENIEKPTELSPLPLDYSVRNSEHKIILKTSELKEELEKFTVPEPLLDYIHELSKKNSKLKMLTFEMQFAESEEKVINVISNELLSGHITLPEKKEMINLLNGKEPSYENKITKEYKREDESVTQASTKKYSYENLDEELSLARIEYADQLTDYIKTVRGKREIFEKTMSALNTHRQMPKIDEPKELKEVRKAYFELKSENVDGNNISDALAKEEEERNKIFSKIKSDFSGEEVSIMEKSTSIWDKHKDKSSGLSVMFFEGGELKFQKKVPVFQYDGFRAQRGFDAAPTLEKIDELVGFSQKTEQTEIKAEALDSVNEEVIPVEFEGKEVQVIREGNNVKVLFEGKEIAKGIVSIKELDIKIDKSYKAGFLLAKTMEEKAFDKAKNVMKTFKVNS